MRKIISAAFTFLTVLFTSCINENIQQIDNSVFKDDIVNYLSKVKVSDEDEEKIDDLINSLDFKSVAVRNLNGNEKLLIVQIGNQYDFKEKGERRALFFMNQNEITRANLIAFTDSGISQEDFIVSYFNYDLDYKNYIGKVSLYNIYQSILFFTEIENGEIKANGTLNGSKNVSANDKTNGCIDWYLITTYYYSDGSRSTTEQYLFTTCDCEEQTSRIGKIGCIGGSGGGGGTPGNGTPAFPNSPQHGEEYEFRDQYGKVTLYRFNSNGNIWTIVQVTLPDVVVQTQPQNYPYLLTDGPSQGEVKFGPDNFIYTYDSWYGSWIGGPVADTPSPDKPIADMAKYLECFDFTKNAIITIYVSQPIPNNSATHDGSVVGHTFVSISQNGSISVFGFYPATDDIYPILNPSDPSAMGDDSNEHFDVSITKTVSGSTLQQIYNYSVNFPSTYDLNDFNCSDFGITVGNLAGLNLPEANGTWPGGGGSNPGVLGQYIRNMNTSGGVSKNTTGGNAPSNKKGCQP